MTILTREELEHRLGEGEIAQLADRDAPRGEDDFAVEAALTDAEAEVMGYVRMVTPVPVPDPAPVLLKQLVAVIARYNLWRREVAEESPVYIAYRDAIKTLREIASGRLALPFGDDLANAATAGAGAAWAPERVMTASALRGMGP